MSSSLNRLVLVLNNSYEEINITTARHALTLVIKGVAEVEVESKHTVGTSRKSYAVPDVIRLKFYRKVPKQSKAISRKGILLRDQFTCQYCGKQVSAGELTLDHVTPRSRGGQFAWDNLVASCFPCNNKKGNRTPEEAGMTLLKQPRRITIHAKHKLMQSDQKSWDRYMFAK